MDELIGRLMILMEWYGGDCYVQNQQPTFQGFFFFLNERVGDRKIDMNKLRDQVTSETVRPNQ
jgi:hypothetical protein